MGLPKDYGAANNAPVSDDPPHPDHAGLSKRGHFTKGYASGYAGSKTGRKRGSRVKFTAKVMKDLWVDWRDHGAEAIARCRKEDVSTYVRAAVALLPKDINITVNPIAEMPDDRLLDYIRGLEEVIVAAIAASAGTACGIEGGAAETIIDQEAVALPTLQ